ncbi:MAG TPA: hypothetical protein VHW01_24525 [Polyangiaceae bacterium]|jgi:hypothetical protein|nr:hypothetical protein [Polyangiaceae bacterium]
MGQQSAAHSHAPVDAPDRELDVERFESLSPGEHVLINAVDERAIKIEDERGVRAAHEVESGRNVSSGTIMTTSIAPVELHGPIHACAVLDIRGTHVGIAEGRRITALIATSGCSIQALCRIARS